MIPEDIETRESYIHDQILAGNFDARWVELDVIADNKNVKLLVMEDALKIEGIRVNVSAMLSQKIADILGSSLPTAFVVDMMFAKAARKANPYPIAISTSTASMVKHSQAIDKQMRTNSGLVATCGKHWIIDKQLESKPSQACNYGWHFTGSAFQGIRGFPTASGTRICRNDVRVIQPNATAHDMHHVDYSQICQLVNQQCWVDGIGMNFSDLVKNPELASCVSHQGVLTIDRQPGVEKKTGYNVILPTYITA